MTDREIVESYIPMAKFIAGMYGPRCEVSVHYLADLDHTIIAIENGYLTGRKVGDTLLDFNLHTTLKMDNMKEDFVVNYSGDYTLGERVFRFSTYYIKNSKKQVIGLLNTNVDVSGLLSFQKILNEELFMNENYTLQDNKQKAQATAISAHSMIDTYFDEAMEKYNFTDVHSLTKNEKLQIIAYLNEHNTFVIKGAIGIVAQKLSISEPTAYRYVRSLKIDGDN